MKHAKDTIPSKSTLPIFTVNIGTSTYTTSAYTSHAAISKAAYRYGKENDMSVRIVQWKIKNGELKVEVTNIETERA